MSRLVKDKVITELQSRYNRLDTALWIELTGTDGVTTNDFRRALRGRKMRLEVVRNLLFRRALSDSRLSPLSKQIDGPSALITGGESLTEIAKLIEEWSPKLKGLRMRGAVLEGEYIDEKGCPGLATMPTKRDLQGRVVSALRSPGAKLAAAMLAPGKNIAGCLKALIEKLEKGGGPDAAAAESAAPETTAAPEASAPSGAAAPEAASSPPSDSPPEAAPA